MPELPEVEVTRQSFAPRIEGARITAVALGKPLRWPLGCEPASLVGGQVLVADAVLLDPVSELASVSGTVSGAGGVPIDDVLVTLRDSDNAVVAAARSDADGQFTIVNVAPGSYRVRYVDQTLLHQATWFGGSTFWTATVVALTAGQTRPDTDATLTVSP